MRYHAVLISEILLWCIDHILHRPILSRHKWHFLPMPVFVLLTMIVLMATSETFDLSRTLHHAEDFFCLQRIEIF